MTDRMASAPGKVVLYGEYAVLDGAPAICMAIDRRARARVSDSDTDFHRVLAPGFTEVEGRFRVDAGGIDWLQGERTFSLVDAVLRAVGFSSSDPLLIELDTSAFLDPVSGRKLGVGSSAALTVALLSALAASANVLADAIDAHRRLQRGAGSGLDVATAIHGGLIEFCMHKRRISALDWPRGLNYRLVWSGIVSDTQGKLAQLREATAAPSRSALARSARKMASAWGSAAAVLGEYPAYIEQLRQFSVDHGLGIFDAGHEQLSQAAAAEGLIYKPCGAGGGDVGVLLGASAAQLDEFLKNRAADLQVQLDPVGVTLEQH